MVRVLLQDSHHSPTRTDGWSGAPGEAAYVTNHLNPRIEQGLRALGIGVVRVPGDMVFYPAYGDDYDLFIAPHYEADIHYTTAREELEDKRCGLIPISVMLRDAHASGTDTAGHVSGWLWGRADASLTPALDDRLGEFFAREYNVVINGYDLPYRAHWNNPNIKDYYAFRWTSERTPGVLVELGVGSPTPHPAPDHDFLRENVDGIALAFIRAIAKYTGVEIPDTTEDSAVLGGPEYTAGELYNFAVQKNPAFPREIADLYHELSPLAGIRSHIAFGQMCKETGFWRFLTPSGDAPASGYNASWNNPCGLGVTGPFNVGSRFPTLRAGITAHLGHLLVYFGAHNPFFCDVDPRHAGHRNLPNDIRQLGGKDAQGRIKWAPADSYGTSIYVDYASKITKTEEDDVAGITEDRAKELIKNAIDELKGGLKHDYIDVGEFEAHDHRGGTVTYQKNQLKEGGQDAGSDHRVPKDDSGSGSR